MSGFFNVLLAPVRIFFQVLMVIISLFLIVALLGLILSEAEQESFSHLASPYRFVMGDKDSDNRLLQINIQGPIYGTPPDENPFSYFSALDVTYGYAVKKRLQEASTDDDIKGIFLRLETPGGTIFGSKAIFDGIKDYQEATNNPVVAYIEGISASGGVMAMVGADAIYADYGSIIGSIGVIGLFLPYYDKPMAFDGGLMGGGITTEGGIEITVVSAGRGKDLGNPFRRPSEEELRIQQQGVDAEYDAFVQHVADNRGIDADTIRNLLGANIFGNHQAETYKLIDGTRNYQAAVDALATRAELGEDYQLVRLHHSRDDLWQDLFSRLLQAFHSTPASTQTCRTLHGMPLAYYGDVRQLCAF